MSNLELLEKAINMTYRKEFATQANLKSLLEAVKTVILRMKTEIENDYKGQIESIGQNIETLGDTTNKSIVNSSKQFKKDISNLNSLIDSIDKRITAESVVNKEYVDKVTRAIPQFDPTSLEKSIEEVARKTDGIRNETAEEIRNKLETLEGEDRISVDAIKGLDEKLQSVRSSQGGTTSGGGMHRSNIVDIDISSDLNGSDKTFNIQAVYNIIAVDLSSFPYGSLRKGTDYTWTPTSITFTDEISASTQLASGQRCIITAVTS